MIVKLQISKETEKAYLLSDGGWIPKSVLDDRGLIHPCYTIKNWFLGTLQKKAFEKELTHLDELLITSLNKYKITLIDLSEEHRQNWQSYWESCDTSFNSRGLDHYNDIGSMADISFQDMYF